MYQEITLQLSTNCTLNCPYCFAPKDEKQLISMDAFYEFEEFCKKNRPDCIHITGGEPSIHPQFVEIVERLVEIAPLVIYSNLTVPDTIKKIEIKNPTDIFFLANLNKKELYSKSQWKIFVDNIEYVKEKNFRLAIGHTFYKEPFEEDLKKVIDFIHKYHVTHFRISQAMKSNSGLLGLDRREIGRLYSLIARYTKQWKKMGIKSYFDCPVPPCFVEKEVFEQLRENDMVGTRCLPKAFVMWDLSVTHCYSTMNIHEKKYLSEFKNIQEIKEYSELILKEIKCNKNKEMCTDCAYTDILCGCPDYHK